MAVLLELLAQPTRRLLQAEQAFFDAHGRGGPHDPHELVIPARFFGEPEVHGLLRAWLLRRALLDLDALARHWRRMEPDKDERLFHKNIARFLALVGAPPLRPARALRGRGGPVDPRHVGRRREG